MGELVGNAVEGTLYFVGQAELERVRELPVDPESKVALFADACRLNALYMIARAGSGHIGSSFSSMDLLAWLYLQELREERDEHGYLDRYFSSKGHDAPGLYAVLIALGRLPFDLIHQLRRLGGLPGHPDVQTPEMVTNTGSLGMGISKAKGFVAADRARRRAGRVFVMTGDGELQEGQIWESLISAANRETGEITVLVDHNKLQSDTFVTATSALGDLKAKFESFGWHVERVDGHDLSQIGAAFGRLESVRGRPRVVIADTVKGRGVSFMEHTALESDAALYRFHSGAPDASSYTRAAQELIGKLGKHCEHLGVRGLELEQVVRPELPAQASTPERLIPAYSKALTEQVKRDPRLFVLDADLALDTGVLEARSAAPERFIECGIAEMDMVSQAGALALSGFVPVCHSFACFLSTRANEQIYNNATERTKVVYVGSLAGLLPAGPGASHQAVRDIAALAGTPGFVMVEPSCPAEVAPLLEHCLSGSSESAYLRLVSIPCVIPFTLPEGYRPAEGKGVVLREGRDAVLFAYGPVLLAQAYLASELLEPLGVGLRVVNLPWLNRVDPDFLLEMLGERRLLVTLDNHYVQGGQGDAICSALAERGLPAGVRVQKLGVRELPASGGNDEVLRHHGLDARSLADTVARTLGAGGAREKRA